MKALITGINGFVAPYLKVKIDKENIRTFCTYNNIKKKEKDFVHLDITNKDEVFEVINNIKPDLIFHLAGFSSPAESFKQPDKCMKTNVNGTRNILDAVRQTGIKSKILVVGSAYVYGHPKNTPIKENHSLSILSPYGESRILQEKICQEYSKNMFIVLTRSFNHTGPGQKDLFAIPSFAKQITDIEKGIQEKLKVGDLSALRDFCDVRDVVNAYYLLINKGKSGEVYNVCSGIPRSMKELLDTLISLSKTKIIVETDKDRLRPADIPVLVGDNTKLKKETSWSPEIPIETTMKDMLNYFRKKS